MASGGKLLLGALLVGGGAYLYNEHRKKNPVNGKCPADYHLMPDGTCMKDSEMPNNVPGGRVVPPGWDEMVGLYQAAIYGQASLLDCQRLLSYIGSLKGENAEEDQWIKDRETEVINACKAQHPDEPPPVLPSIVSQWQGRLNTCWTTYCPTTEVNEIIRALDSAASFYYGQITNDDYQAIRDASAALSRRQNALAGTAGVHVGDCGCDECKAQKAGYCCADCAAGVGACSCNKKKDIELALVLCREASDATDVWWQWEELRLAGSSSYDPVAHERARARWQEAQDNCNDINSDSLAAKAQKAGYCCADCAAGVGACSCNKKKDIEQVSGRA